MLRDELKLTGTKYDCGVAQCGACTVQLNGGAVRSCQVVIGDLSDASVTTIEAVKGSVADEVKQAWLELDLVQCGFCQKLKDDIAFAHENIRRFAEAQTATITDMQMEIAPGLTAG